MKKLQFISSSKGRIDYLIKQQYKDISWTQIYRIIKDNKVSIDNVICKKKSYVVLPYQTINIELHDEDTNNNDYKLDNQYYTIVDETKDILLINKYPGICTQSITHNNSLINILSARLNIKLFLVHRLDKDTRGLIIFAKNLITQHKLSFLFKLRHVQKYYYAICATKSPKDNGIIESNLQNIHKIKKVQITNNGKYALTKFTLIKSIDDLHLYNIQIFTGRTHQIRVHMSAIDMPILGDALYGDKTINTKYNCFIHQLQSYRLLFTLENKKYDFKLPYDLDYNFL